MLEKMDTYIYDLHSGRFDDLEFAIKALTKTPLETEKIVIVITSVLTWGMTPPKMVEDIPEPSPEEEKAADEAPNPDQENNVNNPKNEENKDKEIPEAKEENEDESEESNEKVLQKIKDFEDELLAMNFENLKIFIICAGIPYGGAETSFNYFFKVKRNLEFLFKYRNNYFFYLFCYFNLNIVSLASNSHSFTVF